jgi:2-polyprenyl-6-methoxyphenol hydroxylase-like FAD-dependent oxidoreductase
MEVLIAGAGIAGLTMALTCHEIGVPVRVFEEAKRIRPLGLGINLQPNAVRELYDLGFEADIAARGQATREWVLIGRNGRDLWIEPRGLEAGSRWPQFSVQRGDLEMMLHDAVLARLGPESIVTGSSVTGYDHSIDGVRVDLEHADGRTERVDGAVLLGADGLHSAVRARMFPGDGGPRWGGSVVWRGVAEGPPVRGGASYVVIGTAEQRFITFPISAPDPVTGNQIHNWIAEKLFDPHRGWRRGDWNTRVDVAEFIEYFEDWRWDWLDAPALIRRSSGVFEYPMVDRDPVGYWVHGSVALMGDAAHAMYPTGSNGASQAIVDARVLGAAFLAHGVGRQALHAYESSLLADMSALVVRNRETGPFSVLGIVDERCGGVFDHVDDVMSHAEIAEIRAEYRAAAGLAVDAINDAPRTVDATARG